LILSFLIYVVLRGVADVVRAEDGADNLQSRRVILSFGIFFMSPIIWIDFEIGYAVAVHLWLLFMWSQPIVCSRATKLAYLCPRLNRVDLSIYSFPRFRYCDRTAWRIFSLRV